MLEAERLNSKAALLSNTLADFADDDVAGRLKVVEQLEEIRELWKDAQYELKTGKQRREPKATKPTQPKEGLSEAEIKLELSRIRTNISKNQTKLAERPDHKNAFEWQAELDRLQSLKLAYEAELTR
ncbi:hypothetical protein [Spirosoma oryzicola]|uniref:hypothetical protein n=1 Tax=Spirosoma oryzicola TaxID=2898794 RepID=UPI001E2C39B9|nr:hypothetical protein [Spirosoma oryzicola]UHG93366.1 hypothetical protein LQ777_10785 [Spirosoma oryzicola]